LKRHDNGLDEMGHRSSELLRVLKELLKSDEMQIAVDMIAPLKFVARLQQKFIGGSPLSLWRDTLALAQNMSSLAMQLLFWVVCQVRSVLRKSTNRRYTIVGEEYVDKIMDGEAMEGRKDVGALELIWGANSCDILLGWEAVVGSLPSTTPHVS
jgi:hypothetical protein